MPQKKRYPTCVQSLISVYSQLLQKINIGVLAKGLGVVCAKDGRYNFINKKITAVFLRHDFIEYYINITRNWRKSKSDLRSCNFDD